MPSGLDLDQGCFIVQSETDLALINYVRFALSGYSTFRSFGTQKSSCPLLPKKANMHSVMDLFRAPFYLLIWRR